MRFFFRTALLITLAFQLTLACTSAVISAAASASGKPMLWKLRDSSSEQNALEYFQGDPYAFHGIINCDDSSAAQVWMGANEKGFAIMNTHSYNINIGQSCDLELDREGIFMKLALASCADVDDFENLLNDSIPFWGLSANFGVIDAKGNAAYFECSFSDYIKFDVNDPETAPERYLLRTNFSHTRDVNHGYGYIRYSAAEALFSRKHKFDPEFLIRKAGRNLKHGYTGIDLRKTKISRKDEQKILAYRDHVVNSGSVSMMVIEGVTEGMDPGLTVLWTQVGWPLSTPAVPVWSASDGNYPQALKRGPDNTSSLNRFALQLKSECFPETKGNMDDYIDLVPLIGRNGFLSRIEDAEWQIIKKAIKLQRQEMRMEYDKKAVRQFNRYTENILNELQEKELD